MSTAHQSELILQILRRVVGVARAAIEAVEIVAGFQGAVGLELPSRAVELVGAGLDNDVHRRSTGHALFGVESIADEVHGFHRFDRRQVGDQTRQPWVADGGSVELGGVAGLRHAVGLRGHGALRITRIGVNFHRRREAGQDLVNDLEIAAL